jgi:DNA polymerase-3 subunit delta
MTPEDAVRGARKGELQPVYLLVGDETYIADQVSAAIRKAALDGPAAGFNDERFHAGETRASSVVAAARTLPMMAQRRFVQLRGAERWDAKNAASDDGVHPLDVLAQYLADPSPSTVLLMTASKMNGSRKLVKAAKKAGWLVSCSSPSRRELPGWIAREARRRGHEMEPTVADALAELVGPELAPVVDAIERLSLYVGGEGVIDEAALAQVVTRVRQDDVWALVDALAARRLSAGLAALHDAFDARDGGLPLLGAVAWRVRQLVKFQAAMRSGAARADAAKRAGVPPFKANDLERAVRSMSPATLDNWLLLLAEADQALKGSRRPAQRVLETMLIDMCR